MNNPLIDINRREHPPLDGNEMLELFLAEKVPSRKLQQKYHKTQHFKDLSSAVRDEYRTCVLCNKTTDMVTHHRHYRTLFREDIHADVTLLCARCHGKHHRGSRR